MIIENTQYSVHHQCVALTFAISLLLYALADYAPTQSWLPSPLKLCTSSVNLASRWGAASTYARCARPPRDCGCGARSQREPTPAGADLQPLSEADGPSTGLGRRRRPRAPSRRLEPPPPPTPPPPMPARRPSRHHPIACPVRVGCAGAGVGAVREETDLWEAAGGGAPCHSIRSRAGTPALVIIADARWWLFVSPSIPARCPHTPPPFFYHPPPDTPLPSPPSLFIASLCRRALWVRRYVSHLCLPLRPPHPPSFSLSPLSSCPPYPLDPPRSRDDLSDSTYG